MKRYPGINYAYRPDYCAQGLAALLVNIKGTQRRAMIADFWHQGRIGELEKTLLKPALTPDERKAIGKLHPSFMGGEYLPDCRTSEIEIARIECASVTADVVSIRVRLIGRVFHHSIEDEYGTKFHLSRKTSRKPLTLGEVIDLIDGSRHPEVRGTSVALVGNKVNEEGGDRCDLEHFTSVSSEFYPGLARHYKRVFKDWASGTNY
jgi:hypothetical protein